MSYYILRTANEKFEDFCSRIKLTFVPPNGLPINGGIIHLHPNESVFAVVWSKALVEKYKIRSTYCNVLTNRGRIFRAQRSGGGSIRCMFLGCAEASLPLLEKDLLEEVMPKLGSDFATVPVNSFDESFLAKMKTLEERAVEASLCLCPAIRVAQSQTCAEAAAELNFKLQISREGLVISYVLDIQLEKDEFPFMRIDKHGLRSLIVTSLGRTIWCRRKEKEVFCLDFPMGGKKANPALVTKYEHILRASPDWKTCVTDFHVALSGG